MYRIAQFGALALLLLSTTISAQAIQTLDTRYYGNRIIVKMKPVEGQSKSQPAELTPDKMSAMAEGKRYILRKLRRTGLGADIVQLSDKPTPGELEELARTINARSDVEYAHVDYKRYPAAFRDGTPNDSYFVSGYQWYLESNDDHPGAANVANAWPSASGNKIVISVIDTGYTVHPEYESIDPGSDPSILPELLNRNDFILADDGQSDFSTAADGDGFDNDASDMGDRVTASEKENNPVFADDQNCEISDPDTSSWHGARVASVIAAPPDNGQGLVGVAPGSILQINRALGKCGGYISDIMDATLYSAGLPVPSVGFGGAPGVSTDIINLSLGGGGACTMTEAEAIRKVVLEEGLVVVTAAGNDASDANQSAPGNCTGTINVAANTKQGGQAIYSNTGSFVDIAAPGGSPIDPSCDTDGDSVFDPGLDGKTPSDNPECFTQIVTATHGLADIQEAGETSWEDIDASASEGQYDTGSQGTSFSAPIVSGVISLMLDANEQLTPVEVYSILVETARPFPTSVTDGAVCTTDTCGAGIIDATAAVEAAQSGDFTVRDFPNKSGGSGGGGSSDEPFFGATGKGGGSIAPLVPLALMLLMGWRRIRH